MAVRPITNLQAVNKETTNRGKQISAKNLIARGGNLRQSVTPGKDFTKNYAITLKDVDTSVMNHVKNVMRPYVLEAGEQINIPVMYGNEERWVAVRKRNVLRDKNGSLILPLIMLKRTEVNKNTTIQQSFKHDVKNELVQVIRNSNWSKENRYDRFSVQYGTQPAYDSIVTGPPDYVDISYEFVLWTNYIEQMNKLIESFVEQNDTYWGSNTDYKFLCNVESWSDASEMATDGERFIKTTFTALFKGYLLSEVVASSVTEKKFQLDRQTSPNRVVFGFEGDATNFQVKK